MIGGGTIDRGGGGGREGRRELGEVEVGREERTEWMRIVAVAVVLVVIHSSSSAVEWS